MAHDSTFTGIYAGQFSLGFEVTGEEVLVAMRQDCGDDYYEEAYFQSGMLYSCGRRTRHDPNANAQVQWQDPHWHAYYSDKKSILFGKNVRYSGRINVCHVDWRDGYTSSVNGGFDHQAVVESCYSLQTALEQQLRENSRQHDAWAAANRPPPEPKRVQAPPPAPPTALQRLREWVKFNKIATAKIIAVLMILPGLYLAHFISDRYFTHPHPYDPARKTSSSSQ